MAILLVKNERKGYGCFMAKNKKIDLANLEPEEKLKYEIAEELGLLERVVKDGWKSLSAKETGRIGGMMTKRRKQEKDLTKELRNDRMT